VPKKLAVEELGSKARYRFADIIRAAYSAYAKKEGKPRWGDKTPPNAFDLPDLMRDFPDAQFIHIVRDGRDVCLSWAEVDWVKLDVRKAAKRWVRWVRAASHPSRLGPTQYYELRYEDLVQEPRRVLEAVCRFLGEPFDERMLEYHQQEHLVPEERRKFHTRLSQPPDASRVFRWRKEMSASNVRRFEAVAGSLLLRFNYEVSSPWRLPSYTHLVICRVGERVWGQCLTLAGAR
jgi:hypothetical protein